MIQFNDLNPRVSQQALQRVSQSSINVPNVAFETVPVSPGLTVVLLRAGRVDELRSTSCWACGRVIKVT